MGARTMSSHGSRAHSHTQQQGAACGAELGEVETQLHGVSLDDLLRTAGTAGRKAVDEVWRDIQGAGAGGGCTLPPPPPAQMTLEDFLSRTGAGGWAPQQFHPPPLEQAPAPAPPGQRHHVAVAVACPVPRPLGVCAGPVLDALYHGGQGGASAAAGRKRTADGGAAEKTVERRKKRMIKNRESAARSRARKQAYTNELENKISRLEEENERLKMHTAFAPVVHYVLQQEPKNQLRRINSANF